MPLTPTKKERKEIVKCFEEFKESFDAIKNFCEQIGSKLVIFKQLQINKLYNKFCKAFEKWCDEVSKYRKYLEEIKLKKQYNPNNYTTKKILDDIVFCTNSLSLLIDVTLTDYEKNKKSYSGNIGNELRKIFDKNIIDVFEQLGSIIKDIKER